MRCGLGSHASPPLSLFPSFGSPRPLFLPAILKCCYASIILLWGGTVAAVQVQTGFNCRERWCWVYGLESSDNHCIAGVRGGSDPGFRSVSDTPSSWPWHVTLRPFWQSPPHQSVLIWCLFFTVCYVFSFSFMLLLCLPLSLGWNSHACAQGISTGRLHCIVGVSWLAWAAMD